MRPKRTARRREVWKWMGLGILVVGLFVAWRLLPVREWLKDFQDRISGLGAAGGALYLVVYILAALLFVPGALLTLGAGYLFGVVWGTAIVSVASTAAAAAAFLIARYLARDRVERLARKNEKFRAIDRAVGKNGWKVVGLLRLSPLVPFSVSNYLYGLTSVRFLPYVLASWLGMLPATVLYVFLGATGSQIGKRTERSPLEWALAAAGLLATAAVTVILARLARRELATSRLADEGP